MTIELNKLETASEMLKAIAHPIRISIVALLSGNKKLNVTEIYKELNIEQAVASHHLGVLKNKDILSSEKNGKNCFYSLKHQRISQIIECINNCQN